MSTPSLQVSADTVLALSEIAKMIVTDHFDLDLLDFENVNDRPRSPSHTNKILSLNLSKKDRKKFALTIV